MLRALALASCAALTAPAALLVAPVAALAPPAPPAAPGDALLRQAKALRYAQRWFEAGQAYRQFLTEHPSSGRVPEARFWLAATLESDQRWDEAAAAYQAFLGAHPDQRLLGREAKMNLVRCWGIRQGQAPGATPGLLATLQDPIPEVRVAAALQLAKAGDARAVETLKQGLQLPGTGDACSLALIGLGVQTGQPVAASQARFLVIRIKEAGKPDTVTIRLALALARAAGNYLSDAQLKQAQAKGFDLSGLTDKATTLPKGSTLLSVDDGKSSVAITVE